MHSVPSTRAFTEWPRERLGVASWDVATVHELTLAAWTEFCGLAEHVDLGAASRVPGWSGHDLLVHLGTWPERAALDQSAARARSGDFEVTFDVDSSNDAIIAAHAEDSRGDVLGALHESRGRLDRFFDSGEATELGTRWTASHLGPLPLLTVVTAACYELAVHALDLEPAGAPHPSGELLYAGVASLVDVTGALAARHDIATTVTAAAPDRGWRFTTYDDGGWLTEPVADGSVHGCGVSGPMRDLLDVSAGRANATTMMMRGRLRPHGLPQFLKLSLLLEEVPGLPGGRALQAAAGRLGGAGRLVRKLPGLR